MENIMRNGAGPPRARGGLGPFYMENTMREWGKAAARAAAPSPFYIGKTPCAMGQGRRERGGPGPLYMEHLLARWGRPAARAAVPDPF